MTTPARQGGVPWTTSLMFGRQRPGHCQKHQAEVPALAPRKALKVSTGSTAQGVVEEQAAMQRGAASAKADPKGPAVQGEKATEAAVEQAGEEVPSMAEATEGETETPNAPEAEVVETRAPMITEAEAAEAEAPRTPEAEAVETEAGEVSVPPPVQDLPPS
ncbi:uncharacterized protein [Miscanthus floridulus]|uniref:uncharacterized protein n=1 Tax=Miscanthus floridulus TaxID=154761 RepID=UPI00345ABF5E